MPVQKEGHSELFAHPPFLHPHHPWLPQSSWFYAWYSGISAPRLGRGNITDYRVPVRFNLFWTSPIKPSMPVHNGRPPVLPCLPSPPPPGNKSSHLSIISHLLRLQTNLSSPASHHEIRTTIQPSKITGRFIFCCCHGQTFTIGTPHVLGTLAFDTDYKPYLEIQFVHEDLDVL
jgi:hypothetical protein